MLQAVLIVLAFTAPATGADAPIPGRQPPLDGFSVRLKHVDAAGNFSKLELLRRAARRSQYRMSSIVARARYGSSLASSGGGSIQAPVRAGSGEFLMELAIGTPATKFSAIADTGSDLVWTQCEPCINCYSQPTPIFDPSSSSTFVELSCSAPLCGALPTSSCSLIGGECEYIYTYGDSSSTEGVLATETFMFGKSATASGVVFGCGDTNHGGGFSQGAGLVGLGRGPLSLLSQLKLGKFSYCLTSLDSSAASPLSFGSAAEFAASAASTAQSTPLVRNPSQPSFYYVTLSGITVGATKLAVPSSVFALRDDGSGGAIVDSGTSITYLEADGYRALKKAFTAQMQLPAADGSATGLDLCFQAPTSGSTANIEVPKLTFHLDGADLDLPAENYFVVDSSSGLLCLTLMGSRGLSIIGNFQQQNFQFVYDVAGDRLSFAPAACDEL